MRIICRVLDGKKDAKVVDKHPLQYEVGENSITLCEDEFRMKGSTFHMDAVYDSDITQMQLFEHEAQPLVDALTRGESSMMAFFGLSGRGRRLTAEGPPDQPGIFYRSLDRLFANISEIPPPPQTKIVVKLQFIQIMDEKIRDLFGTAEPTRPPRLRDDTRKGIVVEGVVEIPIRSAGEGLDKLFAVRRESSKTAHTLINIIVDKETATSSDPSIKKGARPLSATKSHRPYALLSIFTLAAADEFHSTKVRARQNPHTYQWIYAFREVLRGISGHHPTVPYHKSKASLLLRDSFSERHYGCFFVIVERQKGAYRQYKEILGFSSTLYRSLGDGQTSIEEEDPDAFLSSQPFGSTHVQQKSSLSGPPVSPIEPSRLGSGKSHASSQVENGGGFEDFLSRRSGSIEDRPPTRGFPLHRKGSARVASVDPDAVSLPSHPASSQSYAGSALSPPSTRHPGVSGNVLQGRSSVASLVTALESSEQDVSILKDKVKTLEHHIDEMKFEKEESSSSQASKMIAPRGSGSYSHGYAMQQHRHLRRKGQYDLQEEDEEDLEEAGGRGRGRGRERERERGREDPYVDSFQPDSVQEESERRWAEGAYRGRESEDALRSSQWQDFGHRGSGEDAGMDVELMDSDQQKKKMRSVMQKLQVEVKEYHMYRNVVEGTLKKLREEIEEKEKNIESLQKKVKSAESRAWSMKQKTTQEFETLKTDHKKAVKELGKLKSENARLQGELHEARSERDATSTQLSDQLAAAREAVIALTKERDKWKQQALSRPKNPSKGHASGSKPSDEMQEILASKERMSAALGVKEKEVKELRNEVGHLLGDIAMLKEVLARQEDEAARRAEEQSVMFSPHPPKDGATPMKPGLTVEQKKIISLEKENKTLKIDIDFARTALSQAHNERELLRKKFDEEVSRCHAEMEDMLRSNDLLREEIVRIHGEMIDTSASHHAE